MNQGKFKVPWELTLSNAYYQGWIMVLAQRTAGETKSLEEKAEDAARQFLGTVRFPDQKDHLKITGAELIPEGT